MPNAEGGFEGREKDIILQGDTRFELLGINESEQKERIFLYFWIHTSFMPGSSAQRAKDGDDSLGNDIRQDELVLMDDNEHHESLPEAEAAGPHHGQPKQLVMELDRDGVDRGRYKGCPFKETKRVFVRLHYNYT